MGFASSVNQCRCALGQCGAHNKVFGRGDRRVVEPMRICRERALETDLATVTPFDCGTEPLKNVEMRIDLAGAE